MDKDITDAVQFLGNDGEYLPLTKCVCGEKFRAWDFVLEARKTHYHKCPNCKRRLYFRNSISVYEVVDDDNQPLPDVA